MPRPAQVGIYERTPPDNARVCHQRLRRGSCAGSSFYMLAIGAGANSWLSALSVLFFVSIGNAPSVSCGL
nr:MAG TPA: hypothetical protein [Caudoviricetes sp.]